MVDEVQYEGGCNIATCGPLTSTIERDKPKFSEINRSLPESQRWCCRSHLPHGCCRPYSDYVAASLPGRCMQPIYCVLLIRDPTQTKPAESNGKSFRSPRAKPQYLEVILLKNDGQLSREHEDLNIRKNR